MLAPVRFGRGFDDLRHGRHAIEQQGRGRARRRVRSKRAPSNAAVSRSVRRGSREARVRFRRMLSAAIACTAGPGMKPKRGTWNRSCNSTAEAPTMTLRSRFGTRSTEPSERVPRRWAGHIAESSRRCPRVAPPARKVAPPVWSGTVNVGLWRLRSRRCALAGFPVARFSAGNIRRMWR